MCIHKVFQCLAFYNWKNGTMYLNTTRVCIYACTSSVFVAACIEKSVTNIRISSQESKKVSSSNTQQPGQRGVSNQSGLLMYGVLLTHRTFGLSLSFTPANWTVIMLIWAAQD